jgi:hypothetical protein
MDCFAALAMTVKYDNPQGGLAKLNQPSRLTHAASVFSTSLIQYEVP